MNELKREKHQVTPIGDTRLFDFRDASPSMPRFGEGAVAEPVDPRSIMHPDADPVFVEQYRRLGAAIHQAQVADGIRSVMVTSAVEGEGKTFVATNLAWTLSRSFGKRVLLVVGEQGDLGVRAVPHQAAGSSGIDSSVRVAAVA